MEGKVYSPVGKFAEQAKKLDVWISTSLIEFYTSERNR